jgi:hypothetical protein
MLFLILENGHSQKYRPGMTPENAAVRSAQRAGLTPENAELLAESAGHLERSPLTGGSPASTSAQPARVTPLCGRWPSTCGIG